MEPIQISDQEQTALYIEYQDLIVESDALRNEVDSLKMRCLYNKELDEEYRKKIRKCESKSQFIKVSLIQANVPMVERIANSLKSELKDNFEDLCGAGKEALMKAFYNYDPNNVAGKSFNDYASFCVEKYMRRSIGVVERQKGIPTWAVELLNKLNRVREQMEFEKKREVPLKEVAKSMNLPLEILEGITKIWTKPQELDMPIGDNEGGEITLLNVVADTNVLNPYDQTELDSLCDELPEYVGKTLNESESGSLALRFGSKTLYATNLDRIASHYPKVAKRIKEIDDEYLSTKEAGLIDSLKGFFDLRKKAANRPMPDVLKSLGL